MHRPSLHQPTLNWLNVIFLHFASHSPNKLTFLYSLTNLSSLCCIHTTPSIPPTASHPTLQPLREEQFVMATNPKFIQNRFGEIRKIAAQEMRKLNNGFSKKVNKEKL